MRTSVELPPVAKLARLGCFAAVFYRVSRWRRGARPAHDILPRWQLISDAGQGRRCVTQSSETGLTRVPRPQGCLHALHYARMARREERHGVRPRCPIRAGGRARGALQAQPAHAARQRREGPRAGLLGLLQSAHVKEAA